MSDTAQRGRPRPKTAAVQGGTDAREPDVTAQVDGSLVASVRRGHVSALDALYARHGRMVFSLATAICGSERAPDVTADVFVALWTGPDGLRVDRGSVRAQLAGQTHRRAVDALRTETGRAPDEPLDKKAANRRAEALIDHAGGRATRVLRALRAGPRRAIALTYFGGSTARQSSALLGLAEATTHRHLRTGLVALAADSAPNARGSPATNNPSDRPGPG